MDWKTDLNMKKICIYLYLDTSRSCQKVYMLEIMLLNLELKAKEAVKGV